MIRTLNTLEVLIHCHYSPEVHPRIRAPAVQDALEHLVREGMIVADPNSLNVFQTTEKAAFYLSYIKDIPFPIQRWEIPTHD